VNFENCKFANLSASREFALYVGGDKLCSCYPSLINRLHNLKAVAKAENCC